MSAEHELKTWPEPFAEVQRGDKTHEIRWNDRGFKVGDTLHLREWKPSGNVPGVLAGGYTGAAIRVLVTCLSEGWGLPGGLCVMSIRRLP